MKRDNHVYTINDAYKICEDIIHIEHILIYQAIWNAFFKVKTSHISAISYTV